MDQIWTFIQNLTWRDWVAIIGLIVLPLSALNAFFNLRTRYKDWRGTKTQVAFIKRIKEFRNQLLILELYTTNPNMFFVEVLRYIVPALLCFGFAFPLLILIVGFPVLLSATSASIMAVGALVFSVLSLSLLIRIARLVKRIGEPKSFAIGVVDFVKNAGRKGLKSEEADQLVVDVATSQIFSPTTKVELFSYIGDNYRQVLGRLIKSLEATNTKKHES